MNIETRIKQGVAILDARGKLVLGDESKKLREVIGNLLESGMTNILVNLGEVGVIDSSGLGEMLSCKERTEAVGGKFRLLNLTARQHELLVITYLITHFEHFEDEDEAIASFQLPVEATVR